MADIFQRITETEHTLSITILMKKMVYLSSVQWLASTGIQGLVYFGVLDCMVRFTVRHNVIKICGFSTLKALLGVGGSCWRGGGLQGSLCEEQLGLLSHGHSQFHLIPASSSQFQTVPAGSSQFQLVLQQTHCRAQLSTSAKMVAPLGNVFKKGQTSQTSKGMKAKKVGKYEFSWDTLLRTNCNLLPLVLLFPPKKRFPGVFFLYLCETFLSQDFFPKLTLPEVL